MKMKEIIYLLANDIISIIAIFSCYHLLNDDDHEDHLLEIANTWQPDELIEVQLCAASSDT